MTNTNDKQPPSDAQAALENNLDQLEKDCELIIHSLRKGYKSGQITFAKRMLDDVIKIRKALAAPDKYDCNICGGVVDLSNAVKPTVNVNRGAPLKRAAPDKSCSSVGDKPNGAIKQLETHQDQLDMDGVMVGVSRQALDEVLAYIKALQAKPEDNASQVDVDLLEGIVLAHLEENYKEVVGAFSHTYTARKIIKTLSSRNRLNAKQAIDWDGEKKRAPNPEMDELDSQMYRRQGWNAAIDHIKQLVEGE